MRYLKYYILISFLIITPFISFGSAKKFDRKSILCVSNKFEERIFLFNMNKVYRLQMFTNDKMTIDDVMSDILSEEELGFSFDINNKYFMWNKNKWNGFYRYILDIETMVLKERFILPSNQLGNKIINLFKEKKNIKKENTYDCSFFSSWENMEKYLSNK